MLLKNLKKTDNRELSAQLSIICDNGGDGNHDESKPQTGRSAPRIIRELSVYVYMIFVTLVTGFPSAHAPWGNRSGVTPARVHALVAYLPASGVCPHVLWWAAGDEHAATERQGAAAPLQFYRTGWVDSSWPVDKKEKLRGHLMWRNKELIYN
jgi:hypothetical protein